MGSSRSKTILLSGAAQRVADHVVDLLFAAGAHAAVALDAGVEVHGHGGWLRSGAGCSRRRAGMPGARSRPGDPPIGSAHRAGPPLPYFFEVKLGLQRLMDKRRQLSIQEYLILAIVPLVARSGMSDSSISTTICWLCGRAGWRPALSSPGRRAAATGASVRSPAISTTQARRLPSGRRPSV